MIWWTFDKYRKDKKGNPINWMLCISLINSFQRIIILNYHNLKNYPELEFLDKLRIIGIYLRDISELLGKKSNVIYFQFSCLI